MRDLASFADVNRHNQGSLTPYLEILSNISVMNDCPRNLKSFHNCRYWADLDLFVSRYRVGTYLRHSPLK